MGLCSWYFRHLLSLQSRLVGALSNSAYGAAHPVITSPQPFEPLGITWPLRLGALPSSATAIGASGLSVRSFRTSFPSAAFQKTGKILFNTDLKPVQLRSFRPAAVSSSCTEAFQSSSSSNGALRDLLPFALRPLKQISENANVQQIHAAYENLSSDPMYQFLTLDERSPDPVLSIVSVEQSGQGILDYAKLADSERPQHPQPDNGSPISADGAVLYAYANLKDQPH